MRHMIPYVNHQLFYLTRSGTIEFSDDPARIESTSLKPQAAQAQIKFTIENSFIVITMIKTLQY